MTCLKRAFPAALLGAAAVLYPVAATAESTRLLDAVNRSIEEVIVPGYADLAQAARDEAAAVSDLCDAPSDDSLTTARDRFALLVTAFALVEPFRFGPARMDNRIERLFFWPDPRGRGLRQVQSIIRNKDGTAVERISLQQKSVAVQGLPALEFLLFGTGSQRLAEGTAEYRCRYARATARAIADVAARLRDDWQAPDGYAARLRTPGMQNAVYRNAEESMQELLQAARQQLQATAELKLEAALGDSPEGAKPKTLPFWRSGQALNAINANLRGVDRLLEAWDLHEFLDQETALTADQIRFELKTSQDAIAAAGSVDGDILEVFATPDGHTRLAYARIPIKSAEVLLSEDIAGALGLTVGFNALDGD